MATSALSMGAATVATASSITERCPSAATCASCPYLSTQFGSETPRSLSQSQSLARSEVSSLLTLELFPVRNLLPVSVACCRS
ncbi:hypothetical protein PAHAL_9G496500 [Panicum hallii]|uniref:Uncharacterized protein n=1 Tax=Panicum hallii TaxID=206008 RepID=A0A2S3IRF4_9POAL|nr:hypothetical protein PAHAL_9G496500 [Panicum hallii]PAN50078.1 hypothetical protein PAHAL_9G496500 [Panicum hallii]PAN50079.1 hypothetical protein PAHAL_9G496500 [Panicum hallii]PAN50080.1 hypothetical protein PAHAL_9G496500 [Panicum hallii]PAN50081.1 hypothetical protein PAHAL_9G496500 [Panicum hallii]